jgi:hypothetical protein
MGVAAPLGRGDAIRASGEARGLLDVPPVLRVSRITPGRSDLSVVSESSVYLQVSWPENAHGEFPCTAFSPLPVISPADAVLATNAIMAAGDQSNEQPHHFAPPLSLGGKRRQFQRLVPIFPI